MDIHEHVRTMVGSMRQPPLRDTWAQRIRRRYMRLVLQWADTGRLTHEEQHEVRALQEQMRLIYQAATKQFLEALRAAEVVR